MKARLTLQEKLRDLREEQKLKLVELSEVTGIPLSTLQRIEGKEDIRAGYQDIAVLAKFYNVSTDYLFGLTDNKQFRNVDVDELCLSDNAISVLKRKMFNNRLVSELLSHKDFGQLLNAIEIYIDRKVLVQMNNMNALYGLAENAIKENFEVAENDNIMNFLQESIVDEDEYLRHRISERFNMIMKSIFESHKKDHIQAEHLNIIKEMAKDIQSYLENKGNPDQWKFEFIAKTFNLNLDEISDEERDTLIKTFQKTKERKKIKERKLEVSS